MPFVRHHSKCRAASRRSNRAPAALCIILIASIGPRAAVAPAQSIVAPADESITHDSADAPQPFPEVTWLLNSGIDAGGYTTEWSCGPFIHAQDANRKADCRLAIRVLASGGSANWTAIAASDETAQASGDETAVVAAQSLTVGDGQVGLTVTYIDDDFSRLAAGNYTITVTGTITAN